MRTFYSAFPVIVLITMIGISGMSFPRLSVEQGLPCKTCHINPTGGGMRNEFGNYSVALNELCLPQTKEFALKRYKKPRLSESLTFGFDMRYLIFDDGRVFRMQNDLYLSSEPMKDFFYQLRFWENGISENYGILYFDKQKYSVKIGRFTPVHGLRVEDHKSYIRDRVGDGSNTYIDGVSFGAEFVGNNVTIELFNPDGHAMFAVHGYRMGELGAVGYLAGASLRFSEMDNGTTGRFADTRSLFGSLNYDRFTVQSELNFVGNSSDTLAFYVGLTTRLEYGLYFISEYNFFDGDRNIASGADENVRVSLQVYPISFIEVRPSYTFYTQGYRKDDSDFFLQFHIGY